MGTIKTTNIEPIADNGTVTLGSSGDTFTVPSGVTVNMSSATQTGVGGANTPAFEAYTTGLQSITENAYVKMTMATEVFDTDSAYDATNDKFVVPSGKGGKYFFHAAFKMGIDNDFNELRCVIYKNGSALYNTNTSHYHFESGIVTAVLDLSATDYVEIYGLHDKGTGENTIADSNSNYFMGFKLI